MKKIYNVEGMHCASCVNIIQKSVSKVEGVQHIDVNMATNQASIDFDREDITIDQLNQSLT